MEEAIREIARDELGLETLETRNSDELDFHVISVWALKEALEQAYVMGRRMAE